MSVKLVLNPQMNTGESIVWDERRESLCWVDIGNRRIHRLHPASGRHEQWDAPDFATSIGLREDGSAIVGLAREVALWDFGGPFRTLATPEPHLPDNRLNEGVVAPDGSFWVGTMQSNLNPDGSEKEMTAMQGFLYRIAPDGRVTQLTKQAVGISNTMVWLDDGRFVSADTLANQMHVYRVAEDGAGLYDRQDFFGPYDRGLPDGSCLDAEGYVWNCRVVGGYAVARIAPDGTLDRLIDLPCAWPTSCTFGGPDLATLYVTSARFTMSAEHLAANPQEGALFAVETGCRGRLHHRFKGA
ncbi:SMP-30/gluconolactonase/LRE family protein [Methylovirgula sp. 4M-Z18]|uniref:SMP-30/gluconolactonase/LRE family protein n=1 Tax=Methylovirgula sp. 4M-Z18 TaxID=2293567 RepID=UPI000E2E4C1D|nr:SMP-30/gluconolactonase/LRE family protein [Methylovirgula sp. 4M-Z18]RFB78073.1 SMP-30/gluconolactonase/LRE family protein [Methylovirgula sp. 4M-Z18]